MNKVHVIPARDLRNNYAHQKYVETKLAEAIEAAQSPDAKWISGEDVIKSARARLTQREEVAK